MIRWNFKIDLMVSLLGLGFCIGSSPNAYTLAAFASGSIFGLAWTTICVGKRMWHRYAAIVTDQSGVELCRFYCHDYKHATFVHSAITEFFDNHKEEIESLMKEETK